VDFFIYEIEIPSFGSIFIVTFT